ncbi:DNA topoisomerase 2 [Forsythia ovata]|uniref:DNA topoisomerase 2 n=1 Tax=Forsythia ovata TaxID=205694 RepID=A0ABD1QQ62_9LAMI
MAPKKAPLTSSNNANIPPETAATAAAAAAKTIEQTYQKKTQLEHILLRPDTYIGSIEKHNQTLWVYEEKQMVQKPITYVPGLYKIFDEILVNAADNKQRDPKMNSLKVTIDAEANCISVYNNGDGVPVEIHQEEGVYVPELIFGHLLTSSNYDDHEKKTTGGRNGYGAKLTNIFSTEFVIETADGRRQRKYKQVFTCNMGNKSQPVISKCKESENWTKVTFKPDLSKFNMTHLEDDVVALMKKRVIDMAGCLGKNVKVELNGEDIRVRSFGDYCNLYLKSAFRIEEKVDRWEVCVSLSDGQFQQVSFVNSISTIKGGTHVDYVTNQIATHLAEYVNKKRKNANLKPHSVRNHLWVFVNCLIDNPAFDSQTKETLTLRQKSFGSECKLSDKFLSKVANSEIVNNILEWAEFKEKKDLKKTDGTKSKRITGLTKLADANNAGGRNSEKCTLILTEGDSAATLAIAGLSVVGRDHYGVFPLRGKLLNVRDASTKQINDNAEIQNIKKILGLQHGKQYDSIKSLRYGHLMIMTDQDHDGSHIKGLLINFIHSFWPSLLRIPSFLVEFITPIVKATHKNGEKRSFYTMPEYESWKESLGDKARSWSIKYYKGLGTSTDKEGKEYFKDLEKHKKDFVWADDNDGEAIELAFSKKKIEARKNWLRQFEPGTYLDQEDKLIKYRDFVNKELILFSIADLQRSIPSMVDGLKPGQRKILFCAFKRNFVHEAKVGQFAGYVSEHSAYHHGEQSLASTIIGMAQQYVGSNNINILKPNGQFGTRNQGGKDHASARYIFTQLSAITRFLFPKDDDILLDYQNEDGQTIEPTWYVPIIPVVLVNGSEGIGTGWSSFVPNYNPRDIIANVRHMLRDEPMEPMDPWYKGFRGTIEKTATKEAGATYTVTGIIEEVSDTTLRVTELPVRKWTQDYKDFLESLYPFIEDVREYHTTDSVNFEIDLSEENMRIAKQEGLLKKFKLTTTISTSNMHLFDSKGVIKKYDTPEKILEDFFSIRFEFYEKRKKALMDNLERELLILENKVRFIMDVVEGKIVVSNRRRADLVLELKEKGFTPFPKKAKTTEISVAGSTDVPEENEENSDMATSQGVRASDYDYLLSMSIGSLTIEKVQELCNNRDKLIQEVEEMRKATINSLWTKDLDALERELDEQDRRDTLTEEEAMEIKAKTRRASKPATKNPRKNNKKISKTESASEPMEISTNSEIETVSANIGPFPPSDNARVAVQKKAPRKGKSVAALKDEEDDDEILALNERIAAYNLDSSPDHAEAPEAEVSEVQIKNKGPTRKAAATKKPLTTVTEISDDEDDEDFGPEEVIPAEEKKKAGRKPATAKTTKPPAGAKKRGPAAKQSQILGQKLITEVLQGAADSPDKKVRKMRISPFNKKSGSVLGRMATMEEEEEEPPSSAGTEESNQVVIPRARPQRANSRKATYVLSDDDSEDGAPLDLDSDAAEDSNNDVADDDSDFSEDD